MRLYRIPITVNCNSSKTVRCMKVRLAIITSFKPRLYISSGAPIYIVTSLKYSYVVSPWSCTWMLNQHKGHIGKCTKWGNVRRTPKVVRNSPKGVRRSPNVSERCPTDSEIVQKVSDGVRRFFWVRKVRNVSENVRSDPVGLRKIRFSPIRIPKRSEWVRYNFRTNLSKFRNKKLNFQSESD